MRAKTTAKERLEHVPFDQEKFNRLKRHNLLKVIRDIRIMNKQYKNPEIECGC